MRTVRLVLAAAMIASIAPGQSLAAQGASAIPAASAQSYFPPDSEIRALLRSMVERGQAKGIVLGLLEPDRRRRIVMAGEAGEGASPLSPQTGFEVGSFTKTVTGLLLADMVRRGEVSLEDPVAKYLPDGVKVPGFNGRQITLLDLATHTSGLPRSPTGYAVPDMSNPFAAFDEEDLYAFLSRHELDGEIGSQFVYSNLGGGLLAFALMRAAGASSLDDLFRDRIFAPLGMAATDLSRSGEPRADMAKGHDQKGDIVPYWTWAALAGAGGMRTTANDMLTYLDANAGEARTPLERSMRIAHQARRPVGAKGDHSALGWQRLERDGRTLVHHGSRTSGFQAYIGFDPVSGAGAVVLANSRGFDVHDDIVFQMLRMGKP